MFERRIDGIRLDMYIIKKDDIKGNQIYNSFKMNERVYNNNLDIIDHLKETGGDEMVGLLEFINVAYRSDMYNELIKLFKHFNNTLDDLEKIERVHLDENGVDVYLVDQLPDPEIFRLE